MSRIVALVGLILLGLSQRTSATTVIYSDLGSGQAGSYSINSGQWWAVPLTGNPSDWLISPSTNVFVGEIDVYTQGAGNIMEVNIMANDAGNPRSNSVVSYGFAAVNNGLTSVIFSPAVELVAGQNYWIQFTAPAGNSYQLEYSNTSYREYTYPGNYFGANLLPSFEVLSSNDVNDAPSPIPGSGLLSYLIGGFGGLAAYWRSAFTCATPWVLFTRPRWSKFSWRRRRKSAVAITA